MKPIWLLAAMLSLSVTPALADDIPAELVGHWAENGACDDVEKSVTITADTLAFGSTAPGGIIFSPDESPSGNGAIHWAEEGNVDNFEYDPTNDQLLYNAEGWGMGIAPVPYKRCK
jgi:hypothetical protein